MAPGTPSPRQFQKKASCDGSVDPEGFLTLSPEDKENGAGQTSHAVDAQSLSSGGRRLRSFGQHAGQYRVTAPFGQHAGQLEPEAFPVCEDSMSCSSGTKQAATVIGLQNPELALHKNDEKVATTSFEKNMSERCIPVRKTFIDFSIPVSVSSRKRTRSESPSWKPCSVQQPPQTLQDNADDELTTPKLLTWVEETPIHVHRQNEEAITDPFSHTAHPLQKEQNESPVPHPLPVKNTFIHIQALSPGGLETSRNPTCSEPPQKPECHSYSLQVAANSSRDGLTNQEPKTVHTQAATPISILEEPQSSMLPTQAAGQIHGYRTPQILQDNADDELTTPKLLTWPVKNTFIYFQEPLPGALEASRNRACSEPPQKPECHSHSHQVAANSSRDGLTNQEPETVHTQAATPISIFEELQSMLPTQAAGQMHGYRTQHVAFPLSSFVAVLAPTPDQQGAASMPFVLLLAKRL